MEGFLPSALQASPVSPVSSVSSVSSALIAPARRRVSGSRGGFTGEAVSVSIPPVQSGSAGLV